MSAMFCMVVESCGTIFPRMSRRSLKYLHCQHHFRRLHIYTNVFFSERDSTTEKTTFCYVCYVRHAYKKLQPYSNGCSMHSSSTCIVSTAVEDLVITTSLKKKYSNGGGKLFHVLLYRKQRDIMLDSAILDCEESNEWTFLCIGGQFLIWACRNPVTKWVLSSKFLYMQ